MLFILILSIYMVPKKAGYQTRLYLGLMLLMSITASSHIFSPGLAAPAAQPDPWGRALP